MANITLTDSFYIGSCGCSDSKFMAKYFCKNILQEITPSQSATPTAQPFKTAVFTGYENGLTEAILASCERRYRI